MFLVALASWSTSLHSPTSSGAHCLHRCPVRHRCRCCT
uniref:Uncharacterized protein n=1 Tax=Arundo donax TaxID=35708 RepID=A0A0A8XVX1_ARUDO